MKLVCNNVSVCPILLISSSLQPSSSRRKPIAATNHKSGSGHGSGRRHLLLLSATAALQYVTDSRTQLLNEYLKKSEENKVKNDKERLDSYYKRNYKDYFGLLEGDIKQKKELSESEKRILEWLQNNE